MADTIIGTLRALLTLDTSQFDKGVTTATQKSAGLEKELGLISTGGTLAAAGLAAMAAEAIAATNRAGDFADQIKDASTILGMSTDQIQRWKYAADQSGVSFDALTTVMRMFTQNIGKTGPASEELVSTMQSLGVSIKDANGNFRDTNTLMLESLKALQQMDDPVERNTLAMQLYGRSWSELADFMEKDVDLAKLMHDADPISRYQLDQAEAYKNKMGALGSEFDQIQIKIGIKLLPAFNALASWFSKAGVPAIEWFMDTVSRGLTNMTILALKSADFLNGILGKPTNYVDQFEASIAEQVRKNNAAMSGTYQSWTAPTIDISSGGGSIPAISGVGGTSGIMTTSSGGTVIKSSTSNKLIDVGTLTYSQFTQLSGVDQTLAVKAGFNPYAGNTTGGTVPPITGTTTYEASFGQMLNKLSKVSGLSPSAKAVITKYNSMGSNTSQAQQDISTLRSRPNSPEAQAIIARVLKERGPMAGDSSVEGTIDYLEAGLTSGAIHNQYIYPTGNEFNALKSDWDRLTGGSHPMLDAQGNVIVYVQIDGQEVAKAVVNKLALLGVSV